MDGQQISFSDKEDFTQAPPAHAPAPASSTRTGTRLQHTHRHLPPAHAPAHASGTRTSTCTRSSTSTVPALHTSAAAALRAQVDWKGMGVQIVIDCTGKFLTVRPRSSTPHPSLAHRPPSAQPQQCSTLLVVSVNVGGGADSVPGGVRRAACGGLRPRQGAVGTQRGAAWSKRPGPQQPTHSPTASEALRSSAARSRCPLAPREAATLRGCHRAAAVALWCLTKVGRCHCLWPARWWSVSTTTS